ncbi:MAG TPA: metallophosphoesterase [Candidatus Bathyarchaeota archaeon]|nr:MAG: metallophosphoesterase [Candidatus Bathyarchaeota archaeon]HDI07081.1 metallophosphoesterase [Candidatus Bathyarchaeota archaeon]
MLIAHISDIHCGPDLEENMLKTAIEEINALEPDLVIVTGDLTENGYLSEFQLVKRYLDKLKCGTVIVGTGNHDYRHTGYLLCQKFFPRPEIAEVGDIAVIYLSSARPDRDEGEVGRRQLLWLENMLQQKYKDYFKLIAMHHHLIPVPDTGIERNTVNDAGDVLRTLIMGKVNLVLCGHKHRPWMWKLENLTIVHAGSLSSRRLRGFFKNSYNIIKIDKNHVDVKFKVVDGPKLDVNEIQKPYIQI